MRDFASELSTNRSDVMDISEIPGVGIPDKNSIHHITRHHGRDSLLLGIA